MPSPIRFYTDEQLGPKRRIVQNGYLLCEDVPIARVGDLIYAAGEVPVEAGPNGLITIERHPEDVFDDAAIQSFQGAPFTEDHPTENGEVVGVDPSNWKQHSLGIILNPRRGDGQTTDANYLYADILVQDADAIRALSDLKAEDKRQISAGYDAEYEQIAPGRGRQRNIAGNHVAWVQRGRCGPHCAVGDKDTVNQPLRGLNMKRMRVRDAVAAVRDAIGCARRMAKTGDSDAAIEELDKIPEMLGEVLSGDEAVGGADPHHITLNLNGAPAAAARAAPVVDDDEDDAAGGGDDPSASPLMQQVLERLANIEEALIALVQGDSGDDDDDDDDADGATGEDPEQNPTGDEETEEERKKREAEGGRVANEARTGDKRRARVGDSTSMSAGFTDMLSRAEILAPGVALPTFDSASPARNTFDSMCGFRRRVLREAYGREDAKPAIDAFLEGRPAAFHDARTMTCDAVAAVFNGSSTLLRTQRGVVPGTARGAARPSNGFSSKTPTPAELNARFAKLRGEV